MLDWYERNTREFKTIIDFLRFGLSCVNASDVFYGHGTDNAWDEVVALVYGTLSLPFDVDPMLLQAQVSEEERAKLVKNLELRIVERIPVPYLTNEAYFCGLPFYVNQHVLIPRSPIAELIEHQFSPWVTSEEVNRVLDLCTGSGCIAIACCMAFPDAEVDAVDVSSEALEVASTNAIRHQVTERLRLIESDLFENLSNVTYDIIVSNPPYVSMEEILSLPAEYTHEPQLGLLAEDNGLAIVERILRQAHRYLSENGILVVEVGNSEEALVEAYPEVPFTWLEFERGGEGVFLLTREQLLNYFV